MGNNILYNTNNPLTSGGVTGGEGPEGLDPPRFQV